MKLSKLIGELAKAAAVCDGDPEVVFGEGVLKTIAKPVNEVIGCYTDDDQLILTSLTSKELKVKGYIVDFVEE